MGVTNPWHDNPGTLTMSQRKQITKFIQWTFPARSAGSVHFIFKINTLS